MPITVNLDAQLRESNMTVAGLAEAIGITPANVFVLKSGRARAVRFTTLAAICEVLACQPGDILAYDADSAADVANVEDDIAITR